MIELPEAVTLARQVNEALTGRRIVAVEAGHTPHQFVWFGPSAAALEDGLPGHTILSATSHGRDVWIELDGDQVLRFGDFGGRLLLHAAASKVPDKHHLKLDLDDGRFVTLGVQMWGFAGLTTAAELRARQSPRAVSPLDPAFTPERMAELLVTHDAAQHAAIKCFFTEGRSVTGIGNGYLHDILFVAGVHPKRVATELTADEAKALHASVATTMANAIAADGRDTERDLFDQPGRYRPVLDKRAKGQPCPNCGTAIDTFAFLGGKCYVCPACQR